MQRAGNIVFRVLADPLRAEVFSLYQAQKKISLFYPGSLKSAKYSVEATIAAPLTDLPSQCHTTTSLVTQFSRLSAAHNPRVARDDLPPDLSPLVGALEANLTLLTFDQLQDLVFALTLWPEAIRTSTSLKQVAKIIILSALDMLLLQIFARLRFTAPFHLLRHPTILRNR